jgi:hypothetical protein
VLLDGIDHNVERKSQFMEIMKAAFDDLIEETTGVRPTGWDDLVEASTYERTRS